MLVLPRNRPLSAVSTNAGATPSLDDQCLELSAEQSHGRRVGVTTGSGLVDLAKVACSGLAVLRGQDRRPG